jgi:hypothetical protein
MAYRIHPANEAPETVLNHDRPMGWFAQEQIAEGAHKQVAGVSACEDFYILARYARQYGMDVLNNDHVMWINGEYMNGHDGTIEVVCLPSEFAVLATGAEFKLAMEIAECRYVETDRNSIDEIAEEVRCDVEEITNAVLWMAYEIENDGRLGNPFKI